MATIADNIAELMRIRLEMKEFAKIPDDVPFEQYGAWLAWAGEKAPAQPLMADFVNKRYSMDGVPCRFEDIFEFERLSKAWQFEHGKLEDYGVNEPRFSGKGLLIEPQITNDMFSGDFRNNYPESLAQVTTGVDSGLGFNYTRFVGGGGEQREGVAFGMQAVSLFPLITEEGRETGRGVSFLVKAEAPVRYMRISTYGNGIPINHVYNTTIDLSDGSIVKGYAGVFKVQNVDLIGGGWLRVDFVDNVASNNYRNLNVTFGMDGEDGLVPSTWSTLPEGVEVGLALPQHVIPPVYSSLTNNYGTPTTRLPETLTLKNPNQPTIVDADEGIVQDKGTFTGFGHIRKIEVK